jgi:hypothetical protein
VEWLAKFHALSYVLMRRHEESATNPTSSSSTFPAWIEKHPWVRKAVEESVLFVQNNDEGLDEKGSFKKFYTLLASTLHTYVYPGIRSLDQIAPITWRQHYDRELQRQRCKTLQHHEQPSAFWKQKCFILL